MAVRLDTVWNANRLIRAFFPSFCPEWRRTLLRPEPILATARHATPDLRRSSTRRRRGASRGDTTARHEATATASHRTSAFSAAFSPVTHCTPFPPLPSVLGFLGTVRILVSAIGFLGARTRPAALGHVSESAAGAHERSAAPEIAGTL